MQNEKALLSRYQLLCLGFISLLSPIIRLLPQQSVIYASSAAWLSSLLSIVPIALLLCLSAWFLKNGEPNEGFAELFVKSLGRPLGKFILLTFSAWLIIYTAFSLRSQADRYIAAAYQFASPPVFIVIMLILALIAALGHFKALARTAQVFMPLLTLIIILVFILSIRGMDTNFLQPVLSSDMRGVALGLIPIVNVLSVFVYFGFLEGLVGEKEGRSKTAFTWLAMMIIVVTLLCLTIVGTFGAELTTRLSYPFFAMIRNIRVFDFLERFESIILALWVVSDFVFISILFFIIANNIRLCIGFPPSSDEKSRFFDFKNGRWIIWVCALVILSASLSMAPDADIFLRISTTIVPTINLGFTFLLIPLIVFIGKLRRKV